MEFKHEFYIKDADVQGVEEVYNFLRPFYDRYPTGREVGEALHQIRRELDLIPREPDAKPKRTKKSTTTVTSDE